MCDKQYKEFEGKKLVAFKKLKKQHLKCSENRFIGLPIVVGMNV